MRSGTVRRNCTVTSPAGDGGTGSGSGSCATSCQRSRKCPATSETTGPRSRMASRASRSQPAGDGGVRPSGPAHNSTRTSTRSASCWSRVTTGGEPSSRCNRKSGARCHPAMWTEVRATNSASSERPERVVPVHQDVDRIPRPRLRRPRHPGPSAAGSKTDTVAELVETAAVVPAHHPLQAVADELVDPVQPGEGAHLRTGPTVGCGAPVACTGSAQLHMGGGGVVPE